MRPSRGPPRHPCEEKLPRSGFVHRLIAARASWALDRHRTIYTQVHLEIDEASISTDNDKRDDHLRSPDFFDAAHFPKMIFDSTSVQRLEIEVELAKKK